MFHRTKKYRKKVVEELLKLIFNLYSKTIFFKTTSNPQEIV